MIILQPDYYDEFKCIGSKCSYTCCSGGWRIFIDKKTFNKYRRVKGAFGKELNESVIKNQNCNNKNEYAEMACRNDGTCSMLNEDNLCKIYINCGEGMLSRTCAIYPRISNKFTETVFERNLELSCPVIAEYLINHREPFAFVAKEEELNNEDKWGMIKWEGEKIEYAYEIGSKIRELFIDIIQTKNVSISKKLMILKAADKKINSDCLEEIDEDLQRIRKYIENELDVSRIMISQNITYISKIICDIMDNTVDFMSNDIRKYIVEILEVLLEYEENNSLSIEEDNNQFYEYFNDRIYVLENFIVYNLYSDFGEFLMELDVEKYTDITIIKYVLIKLAFFSIYKKNKNIDNEEIRNIFVIFERYYKGDRIKKIICDLIEIKKYKIAAIIN